MPLLPFQKSKTSSVSKNEMDGSKSGSKTVPGRAERVVSGNPSPSSGCSGSATKPWPHNDPSPSSGCSGSATKSWLQNDPSPSSGCPGSATKPWLQNDPSPSRGCPGSATKPWLQNDPSPSSGCPGSATKPWLQNENPSPPSGYPGNSSNTFIDDFYLSGCQTAQEWSAQSPKHQLSSQSQVELFRTIQASFQMLYNIYDYTIGMIEELEKHETHGKQIQNSGILSHLIPVKRKKPIYEVIGGIELELKCLQAQMRSLPTEVTNGAREGLVVQTIKWAASREAQDIPYGHVDHYCKNVLEILLFDAPNELPGVKRAPKIKLTTEQVNEAMYQMAVQRHLGEKQDEEFYRDPTKEAKLCNKKQTEELRQGALRLANNDTRILEALSLEKQVYVEDMVVDNK